MGSILEGVLEEYDLMVLNDGSCTHMSTRGTLSAVDLSISSPAIATTLSFSRLGDLHGSDHFPIVVKTESRRTEHSASPRWLLHRADWAAYEENFGNFYPTGDLEEDCRQFTSSVLDAAENAIPRSSVTLSRNPVPWWNQETDRAHRETRRAFNRWHRYPSEELHIAFRKARAVERRAKRRAEKEYFKDYVSSLNGEVNSTELWRRVKAMSGNNKAPSVPLLKGETGEIISDALMVANSLAHHYSTVSGDGSYTPRFMEYKAEVERDQDFSGGEGAPFNAPITMAEVQEALKKSSDTAPGHDGIPYALVKHLPTKALRFLLGIFNSSWSSGKYPSIWKEAIIIPVLKEGKDPHATASYRPISLLSCLSKLLESIVNSRMVWLLERNGYVCQYQAGFRKRHSAVDNLVRLEDLVQHAFLDREHAVGVFFDLANAYDTTWRYGVLNTLRSWNVKGKLLSFLASFLSNRTFRVRLGTTVSGIYTQKNGIPQGSVLSVTLFAVAINGIANRIPPVVTRSLFVDDLSILAKGKDLSQVCDALQNAIDRIADEAEMRGFRFSVAKTACVHFSRHRDPQDVPDLHLGNHAIPVKEQVRFLGLTVDKHLQWGPHITHLVQTAAKSINTLRVVAKHSWGASQELLVELLCALLRSRFEYGAQVFGSARKTQLRRLDVMFNKGLRIATGAYRTTPIHALYRLANVLPLDLRRTQLAMKYSERLRANPLHIARDLVNAPSRLDDYRRLSTRTQPLSVRLEAARAELGTNKHEVCEYETPTTPPWILPPTQVDLSLLAQGKRSMDPEILRKLFLERKSKYLGWSFTYTDGSKTDQGVGGAFVMGDITELFGLPECSSVYTAEAWALRKAVQSIGRSTYNRCVICTDSSSVATAITDTFSQDPLIRGILEDMSILRQRGKIIKIMWVPSHVGILGNERADEAARQAISSDAPLLSVRLDDQLRHVTGAVKEEWRRKWSREQTQLSEVLPHLEPVPWPKNITRFEKRTLQRVATGHTRLTHSYMLLGRPRPRCPQCQAGHLTMNHIVVECVGLARARTRCGVHESLRQLFASSEGLSKLVNFLKQVKVYHLV